MEYRKMLKFIFKERQKLDDAISDISLSCGGGILNPNTPAADPEKLKKQKGLFKKAGV